MKHTLFQSGMSYRYRGGGSKKPKLSPEPDPIPTPQDIDIEAQQRAEDVRRKLRAKKGRRGTILTREQDVDVLGVSNSQKKSILGG